MARYPNLYLVGAPKCGTTSMAYYLGQHPDIFAPYLKEPIFFGSDLRTRAERITEKNYLQLYDGWKTERYGLDASTAYLASNAAPGEIFDKAPDAKILIMVRNPVDAAYSLYWQNRFDMAEDLPTFEQSLDAEHNRAISGKIPKIGSLDRKLYSKIFAFTNNIQNYFKIFSPEHVKIIAFDDLRDNPEICLIDLCDFLDVSKKVEFSLGWKNPAKKSISSRGAEFISNPPGILKTILHAILPFKSRLTIRNAIIRANTREEAYPPMKAETRKELVARFSPEVHRLAALLGRDLSHWLRRDG